LPKYLKQQRYFYWSCSKSKRCWTLAKSRISFKISKNKFWPIEELEEYFSSLLSEEPIFIK
jgi:hypothetical protein